MKTEYYELTGPRALRRRSQEIDLAALRPGDIAAATEYSAISPGTELAAWTGQPPLRPSQAYPRLVGYCNLARIVAVGREVRAIAAGDYVLTHQSHRSGFTCAAGDVLAVFPSALTAQQRRGLSAAYLYYLGQAALQTGGFSPDRRVAIIGLGTLGAAAASLVRRSGVQPLVLTDRAVSSALQRLELVDVTTKGAAMTMGPAADIVINTSNQWSDHLLALRLARPRGRIVCLGFPGRGQSPPEFNPLDSQYFYDKQLTLHPCGLTPDVPAMQCDVAALAGLILSGGLNPDLLLSIDAPWAELGEVYARLETRPEGVLSASLRWIP